MRLSSRPDARRLLALGLLSATLLALQVWLSRWIAYQHWHHLAALIISLALLGFGIAGVVTALASRRARAGESWLWLAAVATAANLALGVWLASRVPLNMLALPWQPQQFNWLSLLALCFVPAFFSGAVFISLCFVYWPFAAGRIYAVDLLAGACGALLVLPLVMCLGLENALMAMLTLPLLASGLLAGRSAVRWLGNILVLIVSVAVLAAFQAQPAEYKALSQRLLERDSRVLAEADTLSQRLQVIDSPGLHEAPGLSLGSSFQAPVQWQLFADADNPVPLLLDAPTDTNYFRDLLANAPYELRGHEAPRRVLLLGIESLWHGWNAAQAGAAELRLTVADPGFVRLLGRLRAQRRGGIHADNLQLQSISPRRYLSAANSVYDVIVLTLPANEAGIAATQENHLFTREGLAAAFELLSADGLLVVDMQLHSLPRELIRLTATAHRVLSERGLQSQRHLAVVRDWRNALLMVQRSAISEGQAQQLQRWARERRFDLVALPGLEAALSNRFHYLSEAYYQPLQAIMSGEVPPGARFEWRPATDAKPFFFSFSRLQSWPQLWAAGAMLWRMHVDWGYLLAIAALCTGLLLSTVLLWLPVWFSARYQRNSPGPPGWAVMYFIAIGLGFMFVEVGLLQQSTLLLDATAPGMSLVLAAMLVGAGAGSYLQQRLQPSTRVIRCLLLLVAAMSLVALPLLRQLLPVAADWTLPARLLVAALPLILLALPMGFALPHAMAALGDREGSVRAWLWAHNGFASVVGALASVPIAVHMGLGVLLALAATCYLCASLVVR